MKISLKWLREYVDISIPVEELAAKLTAAGTEVAGITRTGGSWEHVHVGRVVKLEPHPNADRLRLATVDFGAGERTVVCGAPNIEAGQKIAFAQVGARLINGHTGEAMELTAARIRGVVSEGMVCSEKELGLSEEHEGILVLPEDAPVGMPLADYLGDVVLDLDVTPNRPDCYSVVGVAREAAVLTGGALREPDLGYMEGDAPIDGRAVIEVADPDLCPRYTASLITGVRIGPSPAWMQERLLASGMRPINNVVDVTNYVMLEVGQPLHAFDYDRVRGHHVIVRRARPGESMRTLDGVDRTFSADTLLITDPHGPIGVAGVIGGLESEVSESTTNVLLESANFDRTNIRLTETALRVRTEASLRFDKGLNPRSAEIGLRRATRLLVELCGGTAARGFIDVYPEPAPPVSITLTGRRLSTLLGARIPSEDVTSVLVRLGCRVAGDLDGPDAVLHVTPPWWRPDLRIPDDLVEEVARVVGYDALPTTSLRGAIPHVTPDPRRRLRESARDLLVALGLQEVVTYSLTSLENLQKVAAPAGAIRVMNPMSAQQEYLRTSLRPGLLNTVASNERITRGPLQLFECGRVYLPQPNDILPEEREIIGGVLAGPSTAPSWEGAAKPVSFYDAKGILEALLDRLGVEAAFEPASDPDLHPGRTAAITAGAARIGLLGEAHPALLERFDLVSRPVYLFELDLATLLQQTGARRRYQPISRFPAVTEDLAAVLDVAVSAAAVQQTITAVTLVVDARLFDVYTGAPVPPGKRSLAYQLTYQAMDHTLTAAEVAAARQEVIDRLRAEHGAELRV